MKTKTNSIIAIVLLAIMALGSIPKAKANTSILIQSNEKNVSNAVLTQSATIISKRLKDYSSEKFELTVFPKKNQIMVTLSDNWDMKIVERLLTQKGKMGFYSIYDRTDLSKLSIDTNHLLSLLKNDAMINNGSAIGSCTTSESTKVKDYLLSLEKNQQYKFAWDLPSKSGELSLYALRLEKDNRPLLSGADIESMKSGKEAKFNFIELSFKKPVVELWANITRHNINHSIAIVMDDAVLCSPMVRSAIENGKAMITGSFTETETKLIVALGSNGELPITFYVVK